MGLLNRRRWEDPDVAGEKDRDGWYHYRGEAFARVAVVRGAIQDAPEFFADLEDGSVEPVPRESFLGRITFATKDGRSWDVGLSDDHFGALYDEDYEAGEDEEEDEDLVTRLLADQPQFRSVTHPDREIYELTVAGDRPVAEVVAGVYRAVSRAHTELRARP